MAPVELGLHVRCSSDWHKPARDFRLASVIVGSERSKGIVYVWLALIGLNLIVDARWSTSLPPRDDERQLTLLDLRIRSRAR